MDIEKIQRKAEEDKVSIELIFKEYLHAIILDFFFQKEYLQPDSLPGWYCYQIFL